MQLLGEETAKDQITLCRMAIELTETFLHNCFFSLHICIHQTAACNTVLSNSITIKRITINRIFHPSLDKNSD